MDNERRDALYRLWCEETGEDKTQEWRQELDGEELELVTQWDRGYSQGVNTLCSRLLVRDKIRERFSRKEIAELEAVGCRYRLRLKTGELYLASLSGDLQLRLEAVDEAC